MISDGHRQCPNCKAPMNPGKSICWMCGSTILESIENDSPTESRISAEQLLRDLVTLIFLFVLALVSVFLAIFSYGMSSLLFLVFAIMYLSKRNPDQSNVGPLVSAILWSIGVLAAAYFLVFEMCNSIVLH